MCITVPCPTRISKHPTSSLTVNVCQSETLSSCPGARLKMGGADEGQCIMSHSLTPHTHTHSFNHSGVSSGPLCPGGRNSPTSLLSAGDKDTTPHCMDFCWVVASCTLPELTREGLFLPFLLEKEEVDVDDDICWKYFQRVCTSVCACVHSRKSYTLISLRSFFICSSSLASFEPSRCCTLRSPCN